MEEGSPNNDLLSVNSLAFMVSGTKEIWASTGALANVLFSS